MNPFKIIWLFIKFVYACIKYRQVYKKVDKQIYQAISEHNKRIERLNTEEPIEILGTGTTVENGIIWFNQN